MTSARRRERLGLALLVAVATVLFDRQGTLDLQISGWFFDQGRFPADSRALVRLAYQGLPWALGLLSLMALGVCSLACCRPVAVPRWLWRRGAAWLLCLLLGVGALVHAALKDQWGRPRPVDVQAFAGGQPYVPALQPSSLCARNCSFVSGHAAGGFALMALGLFGAPRTRRCWWWIGLWVGGVMGAVRVAQGRHFASDIVFSLAAIWLTCLLLREAWLLVLLWRRRRRLGEGGRVRLVAWGKRQR